MRTPIDGLAYGIPLASLDQIQRLVTFYKRLDGSAPPFPNKNSSGKSYQGRYYSRVKRAEAIHELRVVGDPFVSGLSLWGGIGMPAASILRPSGFNNARLGHS